MTPLIFSTAHFKYKGGEFTSTEQVLNARNWDPPPEEIQLRSAKTKRVVRYVKSGEKRNGARLLGVGYLPAAEAKRKIPACAGTRVVIVIAEQ
jgi:hypothetical protein